VESGAQVTLSTTTEGAKIYYTIDGTEPDSTKIEYTGTITVNTALTIKAIAVKQGFTDSAVMIAAYTIAVPPASQPFATMAEVMAYLEGPDETTVADPLPLAVAFNLSAAGTTWAELVSAIGNGDKYVALDLAGCTLGASVTEFTPQHNDNTLDSGKAKIVSLTLPDVAKTITTGNNSSKSLNKGFSALKNVTGSGITDIGANIFSASTTLTTLSFPEATTIASNAFQGCSALTRVDIPEVTSIGNLVFATCAALTRVDISGLVAFGNNVFMSAFADTTQVTLVMGGSPPTVGTSMFLSVGTPVTVVIQVPAYTGTNYNNSWISSFKGNNQGITVTIEELEEE
jgi:hypothetical protein